MKPGSQNARLLEVLRDGPATNREIHERAGHMIVNSRAAELRAHGYEIDCEHLGGIGADAYRYTLLSEPLPSSEQPASVPPHGPSGGAGCLIDEELTAAPPAAPPFSPAGGAQLSLLAA